MCRYCGWEVCNDCLCLLPKPEVCLCCLPMCLWDLTYIQHQCLSRTGQYHTLPDFAPISRFAPGKVKQLILNIKTTLHNIPPPRPFTVTPLIAAAMRRADSHRETISIPHNELTNDLFVYLWAQDDPYPLVMTPIPRQKLLQYPWTPKFFMDITGRTPCDAQDCETGDIVPTTVGDFYSLFGKEYDNSRVLKLKVCAILRFSHLHLDSLDLSL
jgi:[histone H3]-dimethyl-L-lysine9 demethylase